MRVIVFAGMLISLCCAALAAGPVFSTKDAAAYPIVLDRNSRVGDRYRLTVTATEARTVALSADGEVVGRKADTFSIRLAGLLEVLEVDNGNPLKESLTIDRCVQIDGKNESPLAASGAVVIMTAGDDGTLFTINDRPVDAELDRALNLAITLSTESISDDAVLGTTKPQRVGTSWKVNAKKFAAVLSEQGQASCRAKDITGTMTLTEALTVNDLPCLRVLADIQIRNITPPDDIPAELRAKDATMTIGGWTVLPIDTALQPLEDCSEITMAFVAEGKPAPDAPLMRINATMTTTITTQCVAVK